MKAPMDFSKQTAMEIGKDNHCVIKSVRPENIFTFPNGILGFEDVNEYVFLINEKVEPFMFMQSLGPSDLCFVCVETFIIKPDYNIQLPKSNVQFLQLERPDDALVLSLVTVRKKVEEITANLMSPIVINLRNCRAQQVILDNSDYPVRYPVWDSLENAADMFKTG